MTCEQCAADVARAVSIDLSSTPPGRSVIATWARRLIAALIVVASA
jgi:hypothetical protein